MAAFTIYLRTALFSGGGPEAHLPPGVMIVAGDIAERPQGAIVVKTSSLCDQRGRELSDAKLTLQLPLSKIDHIVHEEG